MDSDSRGGNLHIPVTLLLMFCIVMFVGSLYYLVVEGPWIFTPNTNQRQVSLSIFEKPSVPSEEPESIGEALDILIEKEFIIVSFDINTSNYQIKQTSFNFLVEKATNTQVIIVTSINEKAVLSVLANGCLWFWSP